VPILISDVSSSEKSIKSCNLLGGFFRLFPSPCFLSVISSGSGSGGACGGPLYQRKSVIRREQDIFLGFFIVAIGLTFHQFVIFVTVHLEHASSQTSSFIGR